MLLLTSIWCSTIFVVWGLCIIYQSAASSLTATLFRLQRDRWLRTRSILLIVDTDNSIPKKVNLSSYNDEY